MQTHLPPRPPFADRYHTWAIRHGFPILLWLAPRLNRRLARFLARGVIWAVFVVYPTSKRMLARNYARTAGVPEGSWKARRGGSALLRQFAFYWVDLFRFGQLPPERAEELLPVVAGFDNVESAYAAGKGVLILTAHYGVYELGSLLLGHDKPTSVVFVADKFRDVERFRASFRSLAAVEAIPVEPDAIWSSLPVLRALRAGRLVAMQGDRDFGGPGIPATFFGERVRFPRGPFLVAMLTGAPIVPTFIRYTSDFAFESSIHPPIEVAAGPAGNRERHLAAAVQQWATVLEGEIRAHPTQWFTFYDYFAEHRVGAEEVAAAPARPAEGVAARRLARA
jgi:KDO2-lipid IV(A) lauroyltransferase